MRVLVLAFHQHPSRKKPLACASCCRAPSALFRSSFISCDGSNGLQSLHGGLNERIKLSLYRCGLRGTSPLVSLHLAFLFPLASYCLDLRASPAVPLRSLFFSLCLLFAIDISLLGVFSLSLALCAPISVGSLQKFSAFLSLHLGIMRRRNCRFNALALHLPKRPHLVSLVSVF